MDPTAWLSPEPPPPPRSEDVFRVGAGGIALQLAASLDAGTLGLHLRALDPGFGVPMPAVEGDAAEPASRLASWLRKGPTSAPAPQKPGGTN